MEFLVPSIIAALSCAVAALFINHKGLISYAKYRRGLANNAEEEFPIVLAKRSFQSLQDDEPTRFRLGFWDLYGDQQFSKIVCHKFIESLEAYRPALKEISEILALTAPGMYFARDIEKHLGIRVVPYPNKPSKRDKGKKVIVFDATINTGETLQKAIPTISNLGWNIVGYWTILLNDLDDANERTKFKQCLIEKSEESRDITLHYLYKGSELKKWALPLNDLKSQASHARDQIEKGCESLRQGKVLTAAVPEN